MQLAVEQREQFGKTVHRMRKQGRIPAELYGHGISNLHLSVDEKAFQEVFRKAGEYTVIRLLVANEERPALIHDVARDFLTGVVTHVDFYQVRMDEKTRAHIPLEFTGEAPAVKEKEGILNKTMFEIEVEAFPQDLPQRITIDLGALKDLNQSIYVRDLTLAPGVKIVADPETAVVSVTSPLKEEVPAAPVDVSAVKVETEEKKEEREKTRPTDSGQEKGETVKSEHS